MSKLEHAKPRKIGLSEDRLERLGQVLSREVTDGHVPGAVALVAREGRIGFFETFGLRDPAATDPMPRDAIFRIYSMTKPIVSVAIMQMVEEGRLQIAEPVAKYIPAFADVKVGVERDGRLERIAPWRPTTVQDLLRHTSGLTYDFVGSSAVQRLYADAKLARRDQTNEEQAAALAALPLLNQPGTVWDYSRSTDVLGRIIEIVSGLPLGEELSRRIFEPLGMVDTGFGVPVDKQTRLAEPFATDSETGEAVKLLRAVETAQFESGGGGLFSTAMDYARFCAMLAGCGTLGTTRILGRATLEFMTADHLGPDVSVGSDLLPPGHGFGLGFAVRTAPGLAGVPGSVGAYYWQGIAGTTFWVDPIEDMFAILMIQAPGRRDHYWTLFRNLVYAALD